MSRMGKTVIRVQDLSKRYRLGVIGGGTLKDDISGWWAKVRGKPNPLIKIGEEQKYVDGDIFWALRSLNFEVTKGEVLGIIGKNGAGKSTLLKLLSQITAPTTGSISVKGRTASLLEVGTGFHPELTGRENVFLNGAILGMNKAEIQSKMDQIIDFSGIKYHIDTPVKRYSSGMKVRLGFAVAAHLEPEILIIDEVLAVGDAEFQKQCLGKMRDIAGEGRTVLFVSHNMSAVKNLCDRAMLLENGQIKTTGGVDDVVEQYLKGDTDMAKTGVVPDDYIRNFGTDDANIKKVSLFNALGEPASELFFREPFRVKIEFEAFNALKDVLFSIRIGTTDGTILTMTDTFSATKTPMNFEKGPNEISVTIKDTLMPRNYSIFAGMAFIDGTSIDYIECIYDFTVRTVAVKKEEHYRWSQPIGYIESQAEWSKS